MDVKIFAEIEGEGTKQVARINEEGKLYVVDGDQEEYLGWIDYEEGNVYDNEDFLVGWAEDDGTVILYYEDEDEEEEIGYVTEEGEINFYSGDDDEIYFGKMEGMKHFADGAAALLFFLEEEEEEE